MTALTTVLSIPSPSSGIWHLGPFPLRGYALAIILGIVAVVSSLAEQPSVEAALEACDIAPERWPSFTHALATLETSGMIRPRAVQEVSHVA